MTVPAFDASRAVARLVLAQDGDVEPVLAALRTGAEAIVISGPGVSLPGGAERSLVGTLWSRPLAASASPLTILDRAPHAFVLLGDETPLGVPSVAAPTPELVVLRSAAIRSCPDLPPASLPWVEWLDRWALAALHLGWRHVADPGLVHAGPIEASRCDVSAEVAGAPWAKEYARQLRSPENPALEAAVRRARLLLGVTSVAIDARVLTTEPRTGTEQMLLHLVLAMAERRPDRPLTLLTSDQTDRAVRRLATILPPGVAVLGPDRWRAMVRAASRDGAPFDLVYRAHQVMSPQELAELRALGARLVVGQLDTIAHTNPWYQHEIRTFFRQRNLLQSAMTVADGVTVISEFARESLLDEAPAIEERRLATVPCGTDHIDVDGAHVPVAGVAPGFVLTLGASYAHKNRAFAIRVFDALCRGGFTGQLVIAGPRPPVGNDDEAETRLVDEVRRVHGDRIRVLGPVGAGERLWLLANAGVVLYPSVVEGYGLVPFEAAALGTPTLTLGGGALAEVLGLGTESAHWDVELAATESRRLIDEPAHRVGAVRAVRERAALSTWAGAADATWAHLDHILGLPRHLPGTPPEGGPDSAVLRIRLTPPPIRDLRHLTVRLALRLRRSLRR